MSKVVLAHAAYGGGTLFWPKYMVEGSNLSSPFLWRSRVLQAARIINLCKTASNFPVNMQLFHKPNRTQSLISLILVSSSLCFIYLLVSLLILQTSRLVHVHSSSQDVSASTTLYHIVFGIASTQNSWPMRKDVLKLWWKPRQMKGCVFIDSLPPEDQSNNHTSSVPPLCISEDTSRFRYTYRGGLRSAIRVARLVSETVAMNHSDVRWYVFGDDDTVFFPENLVKTLSKYDHELWYYIGTLSEIYEQNRLFSFGMAFGGAGFAISAPLARVLAKVLDSCLERYPHLYGSDGRVYSCLAELGVGLTHEPGFHQVDIRGDAFGLLAAHPLAPLVSLHHIHHTDPIFPNMTKLQAFQHLFEAVDVDSQRVLQQTVCYDRWFSWTISVSWGYAVQVFPNHLFLPDVLNVQETFRQWKKNNALGGLYTFNSRELHPDPCRRPTIFYMDSVSSVKDGIISNYKKFYQNCSFDATSPKKLEVIKVLSNKLDLDLKKLQAPRRQCCDVLPSTARDLMEITIRECKDEELIHMH